MLRQIHCYTKALLVLNFFALAAGQAQAELTMVEKLLAADGAAGDQFGRSVSISGNTAVIGSYTDDDNGNDSGSAYVFTRSGTTWTQQVKLVPVDGAADDRFGFSVSISGDTIVIGADGDDTSGLQAGAAYVFVRSGTTWSQQAKLTSADGAGADFFGSSVAVDGEIVVIGAPGDDDNGSFSGSAYVFDRSGTTWSEQAKLTPDDGAGSEEFGNCVSVSGKTVVIGAHYDSDNGTHSGSAYVFTPSGASWNQQVKLIPADGDALDQFGESLSVSGDTAVIGSFRDDDNGGDSGSAYIFTRSGLIWGQQTKILATDGAIGDNFGYSVAVAGETVVIGASGDGDHSGSAYVFTRSGATWSQQTRLFAADGTIGDNFGSSVAVSGESVMVGAYEDGDKGLDSGSAYVYWPKSFSWVMFIPAITGGSQ